ncbi:MAG TPA: alkaline phosphatase family protein [Thermoanaerobaculia bacterium]
MRRWLVVGSLWLVGAASPATNDQPPTTPSLIVIISVDQLRYDYVERFAPWFSQGGFNRFIKSGATFPNTHYLHAITFTGPGHATIGSGKNPAEHGIIGNHWFEPESAVDTKRWNWYFDDQTGYEPPVKTPRDPSRPLWFQFERGSPRYCVYDDSVMVSAGTTTGMSPRSLIGEGLGDRVKAKYPAARVIGIALKDRAAILMAGRNADAAYWFDHKLPGFVSSSYYEYDPKLFAFNTTVRGYVPGSHAWNLSPYIPADDLKRVTFDPPEAWPLKNNKYGGTFPHPINDARALVYSPYGSDVALDFALWTIAAESLGSRSTTPDVLFIGLSSTDYFGHYYGPDSMEAADGVVRLDRSLERFLDALDRRFGDRLVVALTADHGVQPTPEILKLRYPNLDAGRIDLRNPSKDGQLLSDLSPQRLQIEKELAARLGLPFSASAPYSHALAYFFEEPSLYINIDRVRELKLDPERVKRALRDIVMALPGVDRAYTNTEIERSSKVEPMVRRSYMNGRSGDVFITLRPNWIWTWGSNSTTHGQPVENDTHVPLMFWGTGVVKGRYDIAASPLDLARTLGALVGVDIGGVEARVLPCIGGAPLPSAAIESVLQMALQQLDPSGKQSLVAGEKLSGQARGAAAKLRTVVTRSDLPVGFIRVDSVEVAGDRATVRLWTGPIPKPSPGEISMDCGTGHTYNFSRSDGDWHLDSMGIVKC